MLIAVDGPAASGKGTIAKRLAAHFGLAHLDTGLLYRAVGLKTMGKETHAEFESMAIDAAMGLDTSTLDEEVLSTAEVGIAASRVAQIPEVRKALNRLQRKFMEQPSGAILDGRDIGSRICPQADVKLFITANPETRARRRTEQLLTRGLDVTYDDILKQIEKRDKDDRENPAGAFYQAADAHLLDTSKLSIEAAFQAALGIVERATG
ncbi:(d)CMP kinase [uncultured Maritalea sp.]|uniref:(d)CMP kinase n=1 Tax=uncultured Maritalea sp. TaxID=757249 RepID=UPI0026165F2B|nr:(d)CMP kinase [uncultured Maritalea sp.]